MTHHNNTVFTFRFGMYAVLFMLILKLSTVGCMSNLRMKYCMFTTSEAIKERQGKY